MHDQYDCHQMVALIIWISGHATYDLDTYRIHTSLPATGSGQDRHCDHAAAHAFDEVGVDMAIRGRDRGIPYHPFRIRGMGRQAGPDPAPG